MPLPAPNLDDRRFQDLVDETKQMIVQRCPEWTDHNVSDPGVTLIELFAWMTDQLLYRLNRVPDRNYIRFLDLLGVRLYPATPARTDLTFWLSGPIDQPVTVARGTRVATPVAEFDEAITFATTIDFAIEPSELIAVKTGTQDEAPEDRVGVLRSGTSFPAFADPPQVGDHLLLGLADPMPRTIVALDFDCRIEGVGVDPEDPPLVWEAWTGSSWTRCEVSDDGTGGLNQRGAVIVHLPADHAASVLDRQRAGWVRCRVVESLPEQPAYTSPPQIASAQVRTVGATLPAMHGAVVADEIVGMSEGVPGQRFELEHRPVVGGEGPLELEIAAGPGWDVWTQVDNVADHGPDDRVFVLDELAGAIEFGPGVRLADGTVAQHGAVPPKGAPIRVPRYRTGGGRRGNVAAGTLTQLTTAIPFIERVVNRRAAAGGVDPEPLDNALARGPIVLRTRNRAVTTEDYEHLSREIAPEVARVRCVPAGDEDPGSVRVLVTPAVTATGAQLPFEELVPDETTLTRIADYLDERRTIAARVVVEPPLYQGITVVARVLARSRARPEEVEQTALAALYAYFHPTTGGPDGDGWPFGRPVHVGEVYAVLQRLEGVEFVEEARLFAADPLSGERSDQLDRIDLDPNALVFSYEHRVRVDEA